MNVQENSKIETVEEGEIVECLKVSQTGTKVEVAPETSDSIEEKLSALNQGKISIHKIKLAIELRYLGLLNAASRFEKNNSSKRRGGSSSPFLPK
ncbi:hypothetical protein MA16_Dca015227 [Dendrobium catenatum]|uniref:Uncharacterized protein n=1 Tax=Dendrobium catenatum TaxID=906689 RepID=A0A2I0VSE0_9ASPA|nr:hypothetical protein MA16_Dca015227 [Dendrobium catenatum]